eukprot:CAMPEP_0174343090 /NCGR_PEP_ID=MMETSP0810-20121108/26676_1 /TAXON_ID=73025 ORGANISM="Eutreptiella gymnastica-like, Strain CCMP1594" /NCGR_SAMPLE_ID=MMETSP0810 /ASSEMBLY_ACC=CAM_ASM_000659 /LENGTH=37 /DNA_ID= /DNA_START= /DNA_END= /DNA_ORIENTATION=
MTHASTPGQVDSTSLQPALNAKCAKCKMCAKVTRGKK